MSAWTGGFPFPGRLPIDPTVCAVERTFVAIDIVTRHEPARDTFPDAKLCRPSAAVLDPPPARRPPIA